MTQEYTMPAAASEDQFRKLRDFLYERTGLFFPDERKYYLEPRFQRRIVELKLRSFDEYHKYLRHSDFTRQELYRLVDEVTIQETSFFRNMPQIEGLQRVIIPSLVEARNNLILKRLSIWSAACSTGEEPFTLAMIISELRTGIIRDWTVRIMGTDISDKALAMVKKGEYSQYAIRNMPKYFLQKYMQPKNGKFTVSPSIRQMVEFKKVNLNDDMSMVFLKGFDIIFCRNVLIYFDLKSKKKVIQHFYNNLNKDGYLFLGFSESLHGVDDRFKLVHFAGGMAYKKTV